MKMSVAAMHDIARTLLNLRREGGPIAPKDVHLAVILARSAVEVGCDCDINAADVIALENALATMYGGN